MEPAIKLESLTKRYSFKILALKGISMEIEHGACVGFLGPNGAGKSTTIKILTGLIRPTDGKAYLNGKDILLNKKEALSDVGCVVETPDFYTYLTPVDTLTYLGKIRGVDDLDARIEEILKLVKLEDWADTRVGSFSKGMKQRLGIGQALLHDPRLIILDEPSSGLDPKGMAEVRDLILRLKKEGKTLFISSHMLSEIQQTADKVALINKGEILAYDTVDALGKKYFTVREVTVETTDPVRDAQLHAVESMAMVRAVTAENGTRLLIRFEGECDECRYDLLRGLFDAGIKVTSFVPKGLALESVYMEMIK